jgi:hypothetical protein
MHAETQVQVQHQRAVFDQQVFVAGTAVDDFDRVIGEGRAVQDGVAIWFSPPFVKGGLLHGSACHA